jgi:4-aminobutyrate aminotransferase-like enzyme
MGKAYPLEPRRVEAVETKYRKICTKIPVPQSVPILEKLRDNEPQSMSGQPPIVWDRAEGVAVFDRYGNQWLDFSSGVLITNAGHGVKAIVDAIVAEAQKSLLTTYCFPNEQRAKLVEKAVALAPEPLKKLFLLSTGSEGTECALKLARTYGHSKGGKKKNVVVSFTNAFHGRTLGAQMMGGMPALKEWIVHRDPELVQVPFPDGFRVKDTSFDLFLKSLKELGVTPERVAGVITETYQGVGPDFLPVEYARKLRDWTAEHDACLIFDEVQAGFGRCGTWFGFQLYDIVPDLVCLGKGFSSSLPVGGVLGRADILELYPPGSMTSTHSGNPLCCAAAIANIDYLLANKLTENAAKVGAVLNARLAGIQKKYSDIVGCHHGHGLVAGLQMVKAPGSIKPNPDFCWEVVRRCFEQGLLFFAPVGVGGGCLKFAPPLCITEEAANEGCDVVDAAIGECLKQ